MKGLARRRHPWAAAGVPAALLLAVVAVPVGAAQDAPGTELAPQDQTRHPAEQGDVTAPAPVRVFTDERGRSCRVYTRAVIIDGEARTAFATVCREHNGRWVLSR